MKSLYNQNEYLHAYNTKALNAQIELIEKELNMLKISIHKYYNSEKPAWGHFVKKYQCMHREKIDHK